MGYENRGGDFIAGFIIGGLVGAGVALLLAPHSGEETVAQLKDKSIELKERAADLSAEALKRVEDLESKGRTVLGEQKTRLQEAVQEGKGAATKKKEELLSRLEEKKRPDAAEA
jgi:gas vesicle protein